MKQRDIIFKLGLGLQLLLIPIALLWHFSQEANYYYWVTGISFVVALGLFFWPQTLLGRLKRLGAIKLQFAATALLLALTWAAYLYFHHYVDVHTARYGSAHINYAIYSVNWQSLFGRPWVMWLGNGIGPATAVAMTIALLALPFANLYRYQLDRRRISGIKKDDLFV